LDKISLCFPTYNRADKVIKQISFFINEIEALKTDFLIEIVVSDNFSNEENQQKLKKFIDSKAQSSFEIIFNLNSLNLGLVGNLKKIVTLCNSSYIWLIGDDDLLHKGILSAVLQACESKKGMIFINHRAVDASGNVIMSEAFNSKKHKDLYDVFRSTGTTMMFITACIYRADLVKEIFQLEDDRLSLPFYTSLKCSELASIHFIDKIYIDNYWGEISWSASYFDVFYKQVPVDLFRSIFFSRNKIKVINTFIMFIFNLVIRLTKSLSKKMLKKITNK
jgi:glycosyltransferase involved in cell wall biosynthesis